MRYRATLLVLGGQTAPSMEFRLNMVGQSRNLIPRCLSVSGQFRRGKGACQEFRA